MKILNVIVSLDQVTGGGTAERTFQMSKAIAEAGEECVIITLDIGMTPQRRKELNRVVIVELPCLWRRYFIPKFSYRRLKKIVQSVDIIHIMGHWTLLYAIIYFMARRLGKPYVVCSAGNIMIYGRSKILKNIFNWIIGNKIIRNASGHIAITTGEIRQFESYGVRQNKISVIPNGINPADFEDKNTVEFRSQYSLGDAPFILFMGRLNSEKGPDLLLEAFCRVIDKYPRHHLVFAGTHQNMFSNLKKMVADHSLEHRIHFIGHIGGNDKSRAYAAAELLAIPSRHEAMSIVVLEAGITGTPVLLTDQCGFNQVEGVDGGVVVPASVEGLQQGLIRLLDNAPRLKIMGENLRTYTMQNFLWKTIVKRHLELYKYILNRT